MCYRVPKRLSTLVMVNGGRNVVVLQVEKIQLKEDTLQTTILKKYTVSKYGENADKV